jgi:hypothetical protein
MQHVKVKVKRLRWSRRSILTFDTQVRGFKHDLSRRIFQGEKIISMPSVGGEVKPSVPCCKFADPYNGADVAIVSKITGYFSLTVPPFTARDFLLHFGHGSATGGASGNFQSIRQYNKPAGCGTSGALAAGGPVEGEDEEGER